MEEDELGLDEDMKDILGLNDTDSDESDSESEDDSEESGLDAGDGGEEEEEYEKDEEEEADSDEGGTSRPPIIVQEALRDPLYLISLEPPVNACIVCPNKLLKGSQMIQVHKESNACTLLALGACTTYIWLL